MANYSQYGSVNSLRQSELVGYRRARRRSSGDSDNDDLHWIENIWTTTPYRHRRSTTASRVNARRLPQQQRDDRAGRLPHVDCGNVDGDAARRRRRRADPVGRTPHTIVDGDEEPVVRTADDITSPYQGCGRLNAYTAMAHALSDTSPPRRRRRPSRSSKRCSKPIVRGRRNEAGRAPMRSATANHRAMSHALAQHLAILSLIDYIAYVRPQQDTRAMDDDTIHAITRRAGVPAHDPKLMAMSR